jgi:7-carboxy-7-deazaguanine synthase
MTICVPPKAGAPPILTRGDELEVVRPQAPDLDHLATLAFEHHWLQPIDGPRLQHHGRLAADRCLKGGQWRLALQEHRLVGIP